jgi:hypothetical protein
MDPASVFYSISGKEIISVLSSERGKFCAKEANASSGMQGAIASPVFILNSGKGGL